MRPVSGSISTSAMWQPFGKVSGVSVVALVSRSLGDLAALLHLGGARGKLEQRDAAVGADHLEAAVAVVDVGFGGFEQRAPRCVLPFASMTSRWS